MNKQATEEDIQYNSIYIKFRDMQNVKYVIICKKCNNIFGRDSNICDETIYKSKGMLNLN